MIAKVLEVSTNNVKNSVKVFKELEERLAEKFLFPEPEEFVHQNYDISKIFILPTFRVTCQAKYSGNNGLARFYFLASAYDEWQTDEVVDFIRDFYGWRYDYKVR